jgi:hypothetical protein
MQWHAEHLKQELTKATGGTLIWEDKLAQHTAQLQEAHKKSKKIRASRRDLKKKRLTNDHERMITQREAEAKIEEEIEDLQFQLDQCNEQKAIAVEALATLHARRVREYTKWEKIRSNSQRNDRNAVLEKTQLSSPVSQAILRSVMELHRAKHEEIRKAWEVTEEEATKVRRDLIVECIAESRKAQQEKTQTVEQTGETPKEEPKDETALSGEVQEGKASEEASHAKPQQDQMLLPRSLCSKQSRRWLCPSWAI